MAHTMIPHNHQDIDAVFVPGHPIAVASMSNEYHGHGDDQDACPVSGLLFHQLAQDNLFIEKHINVFSGTLLLKEPITDNNNRFFYHNIHYGSVSFRAPPAV